MRVACGKDALQRFQQLGLEARLSADGQGFTLSGLSSLDTGTRSAVTETARAWKTAIMDELRAPPEPLPEMWPLLCCYPDFRLIGYVLRRHKLRIEPVGDDFRLQNQPEIPFEKLPEVFFFFRYNAEQINQWLRGEGDGRN